MKYADIKLMSKDELKSTLVELQTKYGQMQFERKNKTLKKSHELGIIKKDIARIETALHI